MLSEKAKMIAERPAFPLHVTLGAVGDTLSSADFVDGEGMTYHQWLVGQALAGLLSSPDWVARQSQKAQRTLAVSAADAVCEALAEREP